MKSNGPFLLHYLEAAGLTAYQNELLKVLLRPQMGDNILPAWDTVLQRAKSVTLICCTIPQIKNGCVSESRHEINNGPLYHHHQDSHGECVLPITKTLVSADLKRTLPPADISNVSLDIS